MLSVQGYVEAGADMQSIAQLISFECFYMHHNHVTERNYVSWVNKAQISIIQIRWSMFTPDVERSAVNIGANGH